MGPTCHLQQQVRLVSGQLGAWPPGPVAGLLPVLRIAWAAVVLLVGWFAVPRHCRCECITETSTQHTHNGEGGSL